MDFLGALKACSNTRDLSRGKMIHTALARNGEVIDNYVANSLIHMYGKCNQMVEAQKVFDLMHKHDVVSWNALISGYAQNGEGLQAFSLFMMMMQKTLIPSALTFIAALKASIALSDVGRGMVVHTYVVRNNCVSDIRVSSALVDMYAKCGSLQDARIMFTLMQYHDAVSWNTLLFGHVENGQSEIALELFWCMQQEECVPNALTFVAALKASSNLKVGALESVVVIHHQASVCGYVSDYRVANTLIDTYAKCGSMPDACRVFEEMQHRTLVSWTALISGNVENKEEILALQVFSRMERAAVEPDVLTFVAVLKACACLAIKEEAQSVEGKLVKVSSRERGQAIHSRIVNSMYRSDIRIASSLIDMYAKFGSMTEAQMVFDGVCHPDVVCWTTLLLGYVDNGEGHRALELYSMMNCAPDALTLAAVLKACTLIGALDIGRKLHSEICRQGLHKDEVLATCLIDLYGKCGSMLEAKSAFLCLSTRNVVTWTALMAGYSHNGDPDNVFKLYNRMIDAGIRPCSVTFLCILTACSHVGLVEKGKETFEIMFTTYGLHRDIQHYNCMLNILGHAANELDNAIALVRDMPFRPNAVTWTIMLSSCRRSRNVKLGQLALESLVSIDDNARSRSACVLKI